MGAPLGILERLERRLAKGFSDAFGRFGRRELQPIEIVDGLRSAMDTSAKTFDRDRILVPHQYLITISRRDFDRIQGPGLTKAITAELVKHARAQGYSMGGELEIRIKGSTEFRPGSCEIEAHDFTGEVDWRASLAVANARFELKLGTTSVGREPGEADIKLQDRALSRRHFEIAWNGKNAALRDCGSTNGTSINGRLLRPDEAVGLRPGNRISAGKTEFLFELIPRMA
jgi:hypothetical protein